MSHIKASRPLLLTELTSQLATEERLNRDEALKVVSAIANVGDDQSQNLDLLIFPLL